MKRTIAIVAILLCTISLLWGAEETDKVPSTQGEISAVMNPTISIGRCTTVFNFTLNFAYQTNPTSVEFDFSNYTMPEREADETDSHYNLRAIQHYMGLVSSVVWGNRGDSFYFRYGKLSNITMGDGALLNIYSDNSVEYLTPQPGFNLIAGPWGRFGFEYITDDLFLPSLRAGRVYILPFDNLSLEEDQKRLVHKTKWALSFAYDPRRTIDQDDSYHELRQFCFEFTQPLASSHLADLNVSLDYLTQGTKQNLFGNGHAIRAGLWGNISQLLNYNISATMALWDTYYCDYFTTIFSKNDMSGKSYSLEPGQVRLDTAFGFSNDTNLIYAGIRLRESFTAEGVKGMKTQGTFRIDKLFYNFLSLNFTYEKLYPEDCENQENYFKGFSTLRNVNMKCNAQIKINGVKFILSVNANYDDKAQGTPEWISAMQITLI